MTFVRMNGDFHPVVEIPLGFTAGVAGAERAIQKGLSLQGSLQARIPGSRSTSARRTISTTDSGASALASALDTITSVELIPELARHGLWRLIELEVAAVQSNSLLCTHARALLARFPQR